MASSTAKDEMIASTSKEVPLPFEFVNVKSELPEADEEYFEERDDLVGINWDNKYGEERMEVENTSAEELSSNLLGSSDDSLGCLLCKNTGGISNDSFSRSVPLMCDICFVKLKINSKSEWMDRKHDWYKRCKTCLNSSKLCNSLDFFVHDCTCVNLFWCDYCRISFNRKSDIVRHVSKCCVERVEVSDNGFENVLSDDVSVVSSCSGNLVDNAERNLKGKECVRTCKKNLKENLDVHGEKKLSCEHCGKIFKYPSLLNIHLRIHTGEKPYSCQYCNAGFTQSICLQRHLRTHTGEKPFICQLCNKGFAAQYYLKLHLRTHTGEKPFICSCCNKGFYQSSNLQTHLRTHTGDKPFTCEFCNKGFSHRTSLQIHLWVHTGNRPFICQYCGKSFTNSSNLRKHSRVHTGEKSFVCRFCNQGFTWRNQLAVHLKSHPDQSH